MNKKGQMGEMGMVIVVAITLIVGVVLFQVVAQEVGSSTNTDTITNFSIGTQTNGTTYYLSDSSLATQFKSISGIEIYGNATEELGNSSVLASDNYTITNNVIHPTTGVLTVSILPTSSQYTGTSWNLTATTAEPSTYISDSGARAVAGLIAVFFALAIVVVGLSPTLRGNLMNMVGR